MDGSKHLWILIIFWSLFLPNISLAQQVNNSDPETKEIAPLIAPVQVDNKQLFYVRGISSFSAEKRANAISDRICKAASNKTIISDSVVVVPEENYLRIFAGKDFIMNVYDVDGEWEHIDKSFLAGLFASKVKDAIKEYREDRSRPILLKKAMYALGALVLMVVLLFIFLKFFRKLQTLFENRIKAKLDTLENKSFKLVSSDQVWKSIFGLIKSVKIVIAVLIIAGFLNYILSLFPWTNSITAYTLQLFTEPVVSVGKSILNFLPSLAFLVVIFFVTRYLLKLTKLLFTGIGHGGIVIKDFDPEWAMPTFKIVRTFVLAFAIVIAYPYIPGSNTSAFKGVSVFLGVLLSLGSSSFIGNVIAGYSMTYRRAFRKGDRIKVDDLTGFVEEQKLLVTRLRSLKNEEIIIPNSVLLNSNIINYTSRAKELGLILHTTVGIGYETPWRLVHAMLLEAADRTDGLLKEPKPYVLQKALADFAVTYEINGYCNDVSKMFYLYTDLHKNILDVFNENNVQIMTPAYEGDPEIAKVVPRELWETPLSQVKATEQKLS